MISLPKDALQRVQVGQSFAEYDIVRDDPLVFVSTPASLVALQRENKKCFFVGRRGSGKTAIAYHLQKHFKRSVSLVPQIFDLLKLPLDQEQFKDTRQRPFKSLTSAFERALVGELIREWVKGRIWDFTDGYPAVSKERGLIESCDFDARVISVVGEIFDAFRNQNPKLWLRQINRAGDLVKEVSEIRQNANFDFVFLIDRLDESWDGSDSAITALMALMHACVHIQAAVESLKPCLFIRENIFYRILETDNEFSRLETSVVFLDWTEIKLTELVERRLVRPFNTKPALGEAWNCFFETDQNFDSKKEIFSFCQNRPRDVLTYVNYAVEAAISQSHRKVTSHDIGTA